MKTLLRACVFSISCSVLTIAAAAAPFFPEIIRLPDNFRPEGIATGTGTTFYVGSISPPHEGTTGQILVGDFRTGAYYELVPPSGIPSGGMKFDPRSKYLFVARTASGQGSVFDTVSGAEVISYQFNGPPSLVNDVVVTRDAAYFTDSHFALLYRVQLGAQGEPAPNFDAIALPADFEWPSNAGAFNPFVNGNGITATANGEFLILIHTGTGTLYRMDTRTLEVSPIALSGGDGTGAGHGDGILLDGKTLYVVKNRVNKIAVLEMTPDYLSGRITRYITDPFTPRNPDVRVPTTIGEFGSSLYAVSGGLTGVPPYLVVRVPK